MKATLQSVLQSIPEHILYAKVENVLQMYWDPQKLSLLSAWFDCILTQIRQTPISVQHHILVSAPGYLCFPEAPPRVIKIYQVFDRDALFDRFDLVPEWAAIRLWVWDKDKDGPSFSELSDAQVKSLSSLPCLKPISTDMCDLSLFLSAQVPDLTGHRAQQKNAIVFLAMLLDYLYGRRTAALTDTKWELFNRVSIHNTLADIRQYASKEAF